MQFLSNMFGGGAYSTPAATTSTATVSSLSLIGGATEALMIDGTSKVGGTATTVGQQSFGSETKLVLYYFSMHDCAPCREFTPLLVELYSEHNANTKQIEVVFFSGDKDVS